MKTLKLIGFSISASIFVAVPPHAVLPNSGSSITARY
jgi:hypothetical protein